MAPKKGAVKKKAASQPTQVNPRIRIMVLGANQKIRFEWRNR